MVEEADLLDEAQTKLRSTGSPFVIVKYAASLDGRIGTEIGDSRWLEGPESLRWDQSRRPVMDAIMVGSSTVLIDDPRLTARPEGVADPRQPLRIVLDSRGRISSEAKVLVGPSRTLVVTTQRSASSWRRAIEATGAEVLTQPEDESGHVDLRALLPVLGERDIATLLVEGGGILLGSFFDQRLVDKVTLVMSPVIIGARSAPAAVAGHGAQRMADAVRLQNITVERLDEDILLTAYPHWPDAEG